MCMPLLLGLAGSLDAAADDGGCALAQAKNAAGQSVWLRQHEFGDGARDLALITAERAGQEHIKRVTHGGSKHGGCHYIWLAVAAGGNWGWHLAWVAKDGSGLRYARMDGAAWVASPPKRFAREPVSESSLQVEGDTVKLRWQQGQQPNLATYEALSSDEGRSWQAPVRIDEN